MARIIWSERAATDLEEIYDYILQDSAIYARYQTERILQAIERLAVFPESGRPLPEFPYVPHRDLLVGHYRVIYRYDSQREAVHIVTILHGSRLVPRSVIHNEQT